jgi:hypothetical protein
MEIILIETYKEKEGHYILIKGSIQQDYITILNMDVPDFELNKYIEQYY